MKKIFFILILVSLKTWSAPDEELVESTKEDNAATNMIIESAAVKKCDFTINCKLVDKEISFEYKSLGDDCNEANPGQLVLLTNKKRSPLPIKGLTLKKSEDVGNLPEICEVGGRKYPAAEINENRIALFMRIDSRPGYDKLGAVIVDVKKNKLVKIDSNFGEIKNNYLALLKSQNGLKTRLVKEFVKSVKCDCDAAYADDWKEISVSADLIKTKWMTQQ